MTREKGFGLDLIDTINNEGIVHTRLIERIEKETERNLICCTSFFAHPAGAIDDRADPEVLENILKSLDLERYERKLDLFIHSPGGSPTGAERIILTCRSYSSAFRVIVPRNAMSAATLVGMGADTILMSETSELGPIDPQMIQQLPSGQAIMRPASAYVGAYLQLVNDAQSAIADRRPPHPFIELLRQQDPSWIQVCLQARNLSRTVAQQCLEQHMLKGKSKNEVAEVVENFLQEGEQSAHGRAIRAQKAKEYGLAIEQADSDGDLWKAIWEMYLRCTDYVQRQQVAKYWLSRNGGVNVQMRRLQL